MAATMSRCVPGLFRPLSTLMRGCCPSGLLSANAAHQTRRLSAISHGRVQRAVLSTAAGGPLTALTPHGGILTRISPLLPALLAPPSRSLTYYSLKYGKRKTCRSVPKRFLRLHCGLWLRRKAGYKKKLWKKMPTRKKRLREHVFCNNTQSKLLDKMTGRFWKRRTWYLNDPYLKYHDRVNTRW
ncbi:39S ribosomal protein L35, mitochondrial [Clupea harengus]|uniref:Large ribosomal subunit protein bL35m n=1 Tax=Clupea harengus TaxID=7950 RepID=A0A6P8G8J8_CLUHA|nr:39S ribosomal protein L35, mitochondrial [Clupea harengus]XP_031435719.1 39S ribosomal protein L35, mitochondrial [Clupea harengus]